MTQKQVVVMGAGLAGLAAASALAQQDFQVHLLESRPRLGGRASSFLDAHSGEWIDNCQHVVLGCCTNFLHFCRTMGIDHALQRANELYFVGPQGTVSTLRQSSLPAPLHLFPSFAGLDYLTWSEKIALARGLRQLCRWKPQDSDQRSFADWLREAHQPPQVIERFWHVVLVSALSESLERIAISHARKVFVEAFLTHSDGWTMQFPTIPLQDLYGEHLRNALTRLGVSIRTQAGIANIREVDGRVCGVELRNGEVLTADAYVLAVPHTIAPTLFGPESAMREVLGRSTQLETAPITSVHLWFDREILPLPHAVLIDRLSQWIFARPRTQSDSPALAGTHYYQVVISASRDLRSLAQQELVQRVLRELGEIWPVVSEAHLQHSRVVTEHNAVFSIRPGDECLRPTQQTPLANLFLAGDWTQTGWPATMEGAVRSGYLAAEQLLRAEGQPRSLLQPDLPVSRLARWLLRL